MEINYNISRTFDLLRFPLAVLVVLLHIMPTVRTMEFDKLVEEVPADKIYFTINMLLSKVATCAVPTFFCISGYLLVFNIGKLDFKIYLSKLKNRIKTLFIPFIIWNVMAVGYLWGTRQISVDDITLSYMFLTPANFPLWFLRDLIALVVLFPVFYWVAKYGGVPMFIILSIIFTLVCPYYFLISIHYLYISSFYFFYVGIYGGFKKIHLDDVPIAVKAIFIVCFLWLLTSSCIIRGYYSYYLSNIYLISGVATLFFIAHWCVSHFKVTAVGLLASASFFIYCSHKLGPTYLSKLGFHYLNIENSIVIFILSPIITVAICLAIYYLLRRYAPETLKIFTGRK